MAYRKGAYLYVADCLSRNSLKGECADEDGDPIAGRMPQGIESREDEERDFAEKFTPAGAARAEENAWGTSDDTAVAEMVITEISPFDVDTPTTFVSGFGEAAAGLSWLVSGHMRSGVI